MPTGRPSFRSRKIAREFIVTTSRTSERDLRRLAARLARDARGEPAEFALKIASRRSALPAQVANFAFIVIFALSTFDTGHPTLALSAISVNFA